MSLSKEEILNAARLFSVHEIPAQEHMVRLGVSPYAAMLAEDIARDQASIAVAILSEQFDVPPWVEGAMRDSADVSFLSGMLLMVELLNEAKQEVQTFLASQVEWKVTADQCVFNGEDVARLMRLVGAEDNSR